MVKMIIRIGISTREIRRKSRYKKIKYAYSDVEFNCDGWVDPSMYLPYPFDLCDLLIFRVESDKEKINVAWHTGNEWDGKDILPSDIILGWKRRVYDIV